MIRFKVVKGSRLMMGVAIVLLALVIGIILVSCIADDQSESVRAQKNLVMYAESEAKTDAVFASLHADAEALELDPEEDGSISIEILDPSDTQKDMPSILIYHTHTHEAYEQVSGDRYVAIEAWRTTDQDHSVVRVGHELASLLRERGFHVIHDTTDHEQNHLGTAYVRSLETLKGYDAPFDLYIDLHRDAYLEGVSELRLVHDDQNYAQLMLLIGNGVGFDEKPYYEENLLFAQTLTERINAQLPGLCKDVLVKDGRYNQNIGIYSILVEVGHNRNTLSEALRSLPYLSEGIYSLMVAEPSERLVRLQEAGYSESD